VKEICNTEFFYTFKVIKKIRNIFLKLLMVSLPVTIYPFVIQLVKKSSALHPSGNLQVNLPLRILNFHYNYFKSVDYGKNLH